MDLKKLDAVPKDPGVYLMKDKEERIIYVGKAKNLRNRVKQYFSPGRDLRPMIPFLISHVTDIEVLVVSTEAEALLLENTLIKKHQPKFNALLKDDKTFISLRIDPHTTWPMIRLVRHKEHPKDKALYFGPYPHAHAARETFEILSRLFPLRQCSNAELKRRTRPCLLHGIKRCIAPCVKLCTTNEYQVFVDGAIRFLQGDTQNTIEMLLIEMQKASDALEFEKAAALLHTVEQIRSLKPPQSLVTGASQEAFDVLGLYRQNSHVLIAKLLFRGGNLTGSTSYYFHLNAEEDEDLLASFILQNYATDPAPPKEILTPYPPSLAVQDVLSSHYKKNILITCPKKGKKRSFITLANKNASILFTRKHKETEHIQDLLLDMQKQCRLMRFPKKIICLDTSSHGGKEPVTSLVTFSEGLFDAKETRIFKPKTAAPGDDYQALREALIRHLTKNKDNLPDLIIVDGGKGHVHAALDVLHALNIASVDIIGCAKEKGRHDRGLTAESIFLPYQKAPLLLPIESPLLFLIQRMRDKAHTVALSSHLKQRKKSSLDSALKQLPGIGPIKQRKLLAHFHSIENMKKASKEELTCAAGLSAKDVETLYAFLNTM